MNDPENLREAGWRRPLTAAEETALKDSLARKPGGADEVELEAALSRALNRLPDVPMPSNFTARVLSAVEQEQSAAMRAKRGRGWSWRVFVPRLAFAMSGVLTVAAIFSLVVHHQQAEARQLAQSVAAVSGVTALPGPEVLQDFEAIRQLNTTPAPDEQLLALFK